jgi:hypothetical protein
VTGIPSKLSLDPNGTIFVSENEQLVKHSRSQRSRRGGRQERSHSNLRGKAEDSARIARDTSTQQTSSDVCSEMRAGDR